MALDNPTKIRELLPNCQVRAAAWEKDCQAQDYDFRIAESYRSQLQQYLYWTPGRTLADAEKWHREKLMKDEDFHFISDIFKSGRNLTGPIVTKTLRSKHTLRLALDIDPLTLPSVLDVPNITSKDSDEVRKAKMIKFRLMQIEIIGRKYGVFRPPETMSFGDYRHFEVYNLPYKPPTPQVAARLEKRIEKAENELRSPHTT